MAHFPLEASSVLQQVLRKICLPQSLAASACLFSQGDPPRGVYMVEKGSVDILLKTGPRGRTIFRRIAEKGSVLGLPATVNNVAYSLTAKAREDVDMLFVPRERFLKEMSHNMSFALEVVTLLGREIHELREVIRARSGRRKRPNKERRLGKNNAPQPSA